MKRVEFRFSQQRHFTRHCFKIQEMPLPEQSHLHMEAYCIHLANKKKKSLFCNVICFSFLSKFFAQTYFLCYYLTGRNIRKVLRCLRKVYKLIVMPLGMQGI